MSNRINPRDIAGSSQSVCTRGTDRSDNDSHRACSWFISSALCLRQHVGGGGRGQLLCRVYSLYLHRGMTGAKNSSARHKLDRSIVSVPAAQRIPNWSVHWLHSTHLIAFQLGLPQALFAICSSKWSHHLSVDQPSKLRWNRSHNAIEQQPNISSRS